LRYQHVPAGALPDGESLAMTLARVLPYWSASIAPHLKQESLVISAHGNSLRAIIKHLFALDEEQIMEVEVPTANPLLIELDAALKPISAKYLDASRAQPLPVIG
jgi:2,3-bisphosphoglycerate-dependent phosphoglycerate mutase